MGSRFCKHAANQASIAIIAGNVVESVVKNLSVLLNTFYYVAALQSFKWAAQRIGLSRSVVMSHVQQLESLYQVRLIIRTTRSFSLTPEGVRIQKLAKGMIDLTRSAQATLESMRGGGESKVCLQVPVVLDEPWLHSLLTEFQLNNPDIQLDVRLDEALGDLVSKNVDIALHIGEIEDCGYVAIRLMQLDTYVIGSPAYWQRYGRPRHPSELSQHRCIHYRHCKTGTTWTFRNPENQCMESFSITPRCVVDSEDMMVAMALEGLGVSTALGISCDQHLAAGRLQSVLSDWTYGVPVYAVMPRHEAQPQSMRLLLEQLRACSRH